MQNSKWHVIVCFCRIYSESGPVNVYFWSVQYVMGMQTCVSVECTDGNGSLEYSADSGHEKMCFYRVR